jgi:hypothetical protein
MSVQRLRRSRPVVAVVDPRHNLQTVAHAVTDERGLRRRVSIVRYRGAAPAGPREIVAADDGGDFDTSSRSTDDCESVRCARADPRVNQRLAGSSSNAPKR